MVNKNLNTFEGLNAIQDFLIRIMDPTYHLSNCLLFLILLQIKAYGFSPSS